MHDRNPGLRSYHRACGGRIDIADHDDPIGTLLGDDPFVADHDPARLLRVRAAADLEMEIRLGHAEVTEKGVRHPGVVVLAGVDNPRPAPAGSRQRMVERRDLHEIRPRRGDQVHGEHVSNRS